MKVYKKIASLLTAIENCRKSGNDEWLHRHEVALADIVKNRLPSGSGWDTGTTLDRERSTPEKLVFTGSFHHMDEVGGYDGWTDHVIFVWPSLLHEIDITITGRDRNEIKDYLGELFHFVLVEDVANERLPA